MPMSLDWSTGLSPGTRPGCEGTTNARATRATPVAMAKRRPCRQSFSIAMATAIRTIQPTFITPMTTSTTIRPQQQPTQ